jgi:hypothetical protein
VLAIRVSLARERAGVHLVRQPETGQRHAGKANAEFLQRRASRDRLSQTFGGFIELVVHSFQFIFTFGIAARLNCQNPV